MLDINRLVRTVMSRPKSLAALVGTIWGLFVVGLPRLNPLNVDWLRTGDLTSAYVNLMYFRQSSWFQWPITALPRYGEGWSTMFNEVGVVPLGLIVKLLDPILPAHFQYFGLWTVGCFALQGVFSYMLLHRFKVSGVVLWLGVMLFVTAPILSQRFVSLGHHDLMAHWLILVSLYQYFETRLKPYRLGLTLLTASSVNAYLFVIVFSITVAHIVALSVVRPRSVSGGSLLRALPVILGPSALAYIAFGYLSWGRGVVGVGEFRLSLWAFLARGFGGEEFAFLGVGALIAVVIGSVALAYQRRTLSLRHIPLVICVVFLFLVALSNQVKVGPWFFSYPIPEWAETARQVVRVSNRLSWALYYLAILVGVIGLHQLFRQRSRIGWALVIAIAFGQSIDRFPSVASPTPLARWSVLQDERWTNWRDSIDRVVLYPVFDVQARDTQSKPVVLADTRDWVDIIWWTAERNMAINFAYRSRPVTEFVAKENVRLSQLLAAGLLDERTLYITADRNEWRAVVPLLPLSMDTVFVDGLYVIYPVRAPNS